MSKIITFGEVMLRLSSTNFQRIEQAKQFDVGFGGGEANVAISLARFNEHAYFVTKVPDNPVGKALMNHLRTFQVYTDYIAQGGERLGIYYLEPGVSIRPSQVIYDRQHSAISQASEEDFNFDEIFKDADWFHWSGITPALSVHTRKLILKACQIAKKHNVTISVDLNYRNKLWTPEEAQETMKPLMKYVDVCIGNEEDAKLVLGYQLKKSDISNGQVDMDEYRKLQKDMIKDFSFKFVATTLRESLSASHNIWHACAYDGKHFIESNTYDIQPIVDRVGAGDSFSAGFIYGLLNKDDLKEALEFATAASALKHTIQGDQNISSVSEIEALLKGDRSGRIKR